MQDEARQGKPMSIREILSDVTDANIELWLSPENLGTRRVREFGGFEIVDAVDGVESAEREVSLVRIKEVGQYPQHVHEASDAYFVIVSGEAYFLSGADRRLVRAGDRIEIPRGTPHGFELEPGKVLEFISVQSPPIRHPETGREDFHLYDLV